MRDTHYFDLHPGQQKLDLCTLLCCHWQSPAIRLSSRHVPVQTTVYIWHNCHVSVSNWHYDISPSRCGGNMCLAVTLDNVDTSPIRTKNCHCNLWPAVSVCSFETDVYRKIPDHRSVTWMRGFVWILSQTVFYTLWRLRLIFIFEIWISGLAGNSPRWHPNLRHAQNDIYNIKCQNRPSTTINIYFRIQICAVKFWCRKFPGKFTSQDSIWPYRDTRNDVEVSSASNGGGWYLKIDQSQFGNSGIKITSPVLFVWVRKNLSIVENYSAVGIHLPTPPLHLQRVILPSKFSEKFLTTSLRSR